MTDVSAGSTAPVIPASETTPPAANAVPAPDAPAGQDQALDKPVQAPKTYSEEEVRKTVNDRLTKERRRMAREARTEVERDFWREQAAQGRQPQGKTDQPKAEPKASDYPDWDSYQDAKLEYKLEQRDAKRREESQRDAGQQRDERGMAEYAQRVQSRMSKAAAKYPDFQEVIDNGVFSKPMTAFIADAAKDGGELAYHLGNNVEEAMRIAQLSPSQQIVEMHLLESKLTAPPNPTKAPPPIVPGGQSASAKKEWKDMTTTEHIKAYRDRKQRRA